MKNANQCETRLQAWLTEGLSLGTPPASPSEVGCLLTESRLLTVGPHMPTVGQAKEKTRDKMPTMPQEKVTAQVNLGNTELGYFLGTLHLTVSQNTEIL